MSKLILAVSNAIAKTSNTNMVVSNTPGYSEVFAGGIGFLARRISQTNGQSYRYRTVVNNEVVIFDKSDFASENKLSDKEASKLLFGKLEEKFGCTVIPEFKLNVLKFKNTKGKTLCVITRDKTNRCNRNVKQKFTTEGIKTELAEIAYVSARYAIPMQNLTLETARLLLTR